MRLIRFLDFLLFPDKYIHQVYVWDVITSGKDMLCVEAVWCGEELTIDLPLSRFSWVKAVWILSGRMK